MSTQPEDQASPKSKADSKADKKNAAKVKRPRGFSLKEFDYKIDEIAKGLSIPFKLDKKFKNTLKEKLLREALGKLTETMVRDELKNAISGI